MESSKSEFYGRMLQAKLTELAVNHLNVDAIAVERVADSVDELILANERDLALRALTWDAGVHRHVSAALERLKSGTFGFCLQCTEPIPDRRLQALPWAALCLKCQEIADKAKGTEEADLSWLLSAAA